MTPKTPGRPPGTGPFGQIRPRLDRETYDAIVAAAAVEELTPAQWAGRACRRELERERARRTLALGG